MFELITDVPVAILEFYLEETRNEPTGEMVEEQYTYIDENEQEQTGTKMVPEFVDNLHVIMTPRPQAIYWDKVDQIIDKHLGERDAVVNKFIDLAVQTEKWAFHDAYLVWMAECTTVQLYNSTEQFDKEGESIVFELKDLPIEPVFSDSGSEKLAAVHNAKYKRDTGQYGDITVNGLTFDCDAISYKKMQGTIASWDSLVNDSTLISTGIVLDEQLGWTLADNTVTYISMAKLQAVVDAVAVRAALLQAQYTEAKLP